jgi:sugar O-acyltransferase (sialic acid O-acetyltransferase NeuD family)
MSRVMWIAGAGGHGAVVAEAALASGWSSVEFFDDRWPGLSSTRGMPVQGTLAALRQRLASPTARQTGVLVAIGDNNHRLELTLALAQAGATLATVVHPFTAVSPTATLGPGTVVLAGAVLNAGARLGQACIVNTRASIDHDCSIGDGVHICPGAALAGQVSVHDLAWLGIGCSVIQGVTVGRGAFVAAGAAVVRDVPAGIRVAGCPAKEMQGVR